MNDKIIERTIGRVLMVGASFATLFLLTNTVTDPVNVTKLFIVGGLGFALLAVTIVFNSRYLYSHFKFFVLALLLFNFAALNAVLHSDSPLTQNLFGSYGRNTGFITYLVLSFVALGTLGLKERDSFKKIIFGLQIAGIVNVFYCAWVLAFGDFIGWSNPYGKILGLFGNPDFISAFLGIFNATILALIATPTISWRRRIVALLVVIISIFEIVKSHAIQGVVVTAGGVVVVGFFWVKSRFQRASLTFTYLFLAVIAGILGLLGALQKGPLAFIYKTSVSLRGAYWNAGLTMGLDHPLTGVGMDSYGDWYRRARSLNAATVLPGPNTITNAAHNVVIDFFAYGGFPLLISYLLMLSLAGVSSFRVIRRTSNYDATFVALFSAWACYEVQSIISINQIGLAIWGWILTAALVSYEVAGRNATQPNIGIRRAHSQRNVASGRVVSPQLVAGIGAVVGLMVALPPLNADSKWKSALGSGDATKVLNALEPNFMSPADSSRYSQAVQLFVNNNLPDQALKVALKATEFNKDNFDSWKIIYFIQPTSQSEKALALRNMKRLDPLNPDVTAQP